MHKKTLLFTIILLFAFITSIPKVYGANYTLTVESIPTGITFYLNASSQTTEYSASIVEGIYNISFPAIHTNGGLTWNFVTWQDNASNTNRERFITLSSDSEYLAIYRSEYTDINFTSIEPVFLSGMNDYYTLTGLYNDGGENTDFHQQLIDKSPYENHGVLYPLNATTYTSVTQKWGRFGKALEFDGIDDYIQIDNSDSLNISDAITVEFWFMTYNATPNQKMISRYTSPDLEYIIGIIDGKLYMELTTNGSLYTDTTSSSNITEGIFYHVALTYDYRDGYYTTYLHGIPNFFVETDGQRINQTNSNITMGMIDSSGSFPFNGIIDELRIYPYKRSHGQIYADARIPIRQFYKWAFQRRDTGNDAFEGLTVNDYQLPYAYANNTNTVTYIRTIHYIHGFQQYQLYFNMTLDTDDGTHTTSNITWYWSFFRHGILQKTYWLTLEPVTVTTRINVWRIYFGMDSVVQFHSFVNNMTFSDNSLLGIVSAWIGADNRQFTMRFDVQDIRQISSWTGQFPPYTFSFDLQDIDGNIRNIRWFDGYVINGIKASANQEDAGTFVDIRIASHKFIGVGTLLLIAVTIGIIALVAYTFFQGRPVTYEELIDTSAETGQTIREALDQAVTTIEETIKEAEVSLTPITESVGTAVRSVGDVVADALAGLAHDIIGAMSGITQTLGDIMQPLTSILLDLAESIAGAFVTFMTPLIGALLNAINILGATVVLGLDALLQSIFGEPEMFTNLVSGITNFLATIPTLAVNAGISINTLVIGLVSILTSITTTVIAFFGFVAYALPLAFQPVANALTSFTDFWNGTGDFTGGIAFGQIFPLIALVYFAVRFYNGGIGGIISDVEKASSLIRAIGWILMWFYHLLVSLLSTIMSFIPFFG